MALLPPFIEGVVEEVREGAFGEGVPPLLPEEEPDPPPLGKVGEALGVLPAPTPKEAVGKGGEVRVIEGDCVFPNSCRGLVVETRVAAEVKVRVDWEEADRAALPLPKSRVGVALCSGEGVMPRVRVFAAGEEEGDTPPLLLPLPLPDPGRREREGEGEEVPAAAATPAPAPELNVAHPLGVRVAAAPVAVGALTLPPTPAVLVRVADTVPPPPPSMVGELEREGDPVVDLDCRGEAVLDGEPVSKGDRVLEGV